MWRVVYACDVGSTRTDRRRRGQSGFGWARAVTPERVEGGTSIDDLAVRIGEDMRAGCSIALGFEAPVFIPVPESSSDLCRGRAGEGARSFAAPAGLAVTALGLHQAAWVLRAIVDARRGHRFLQQASDWPCSGPALFCWEAFVSEAAHSADHVRDAATAVVAFIAAEADLSAATAVRAERPLSLIGAAALWSGWAEEMEELRAETAVIRPQTAYTGSIASSRSRS